MARNVELKFGWSPSKIDGTEYKFSPIKNLKVPEQYTFQEHMPPILNQGSTNMCVTFALSAHIDWNINMDYGTDKKDNNVDRKSIYSARKTSGDRGMTFKEALSYVRKNGVKTSRGIRKIDHYAIIGSPEMLKQAIIANGPCIAGLVAYNSRPEFWNKSLNDECLGGHAVAIVGYNKDGFVIRNSWGTSYGFKGYATLRYEDFSKIRECWTIVD